MLKRVSSSEVKGQGHMYKCVNAITAEAYISTPYSVEACLQEVTSTCCLPSKFDLSYQ